MNNSNRILWILIGALLVLNLLTLGNFWWSTQSQPSSKHQHRGPLYMIEQLEWDASQIAQFKAAKDRHRMVMSDLIKEQQSLRKELFGLVKADKPSEAEALIEKLGLLKESIEQATFMHFRELRSICREDQKEHFDSLIQDLSTHFGPPPPHFRGKDGHHGRPPHGQGPHGQGPGPRH